MLGFACEMSPVASAARTYLPQNSVVRRLSRDLDDILGEGAWSVGTEASITGRIGSKG